MFDDLFSCMSSVAGGTITAAEMLNKRECSIAINWQGGWHHAQRYAAHDLLVLFINPHNSPYGQKIKEHIFCYILVIYTLNKNLPA